MELIASCKVGIRPFPVGSVSDSRYLDGGEGEKPGTRRQEPTSRYSLASEMPLHSGNSFAESHHTRKTTRHRRHRIESSQRSRLASANTGRSHTFTLIQSWILGPEDGQKSEVSSVLEKSQYRGIVILRGYDRIHHRTQGSKS